MGAPSGPLSAVLRCDAHLLPRVRYVFDTLFAAAGIPLRYTESAPVAGPWVLYAGSPQLDAASGRALIVMHDAEAWRRFETTNAAPAVASRYEDLPVVFPVRGGGPPPGAASIGFDIIANAFYFLSSWDERSANSELRATRRLHGASEFRRLGIPQDIVDRYLAYLVTRLRHVCSQNSVPAWPEPSWPDNRRFSLVLTHDVDYLPVHPWDNHVQGAKAVLRQLVRQHDPGDAWRAARGYLSAVAAGRDPYGCVPEIIAREQALGVRSSFQVAVGHRHPADVNYRIEDDRVRDYLRAITDAGFDLCLHGSYRSTEDPQWYQDEVELLAQRLERPLGSRQHFLSFDYDTLFTAQEAAGIRYDMSMGYPDHPGPRAGFSYPYFPYNLREDRPYRVLQISLFLMDVTLRSYMGLRPGHARDVIDASLRDLAEKRGCASAVWHPIVFGNARDPGYGALYFEMIERVRALDGLATDGRTIDAYWRSRARDYASFEFA